MIKGYSKKRLALNKYRKHLIAYRAVFTRESYAWCYITLDDLLDLTKKHRNLKYHPYKHKHHKFNRKYNPLEIYNMEISYVNN